MAANGTPYSTTCVAEFSWKLWTSHHIEQHGKIWCTFVVPNFAYSKCAPSVTCFEGKKHHPSRTFQYFCWHCPVRLAVFTEAHGNHVGCLTSRQTSRAHTFRKRKKQCLSVLYSLQAFPVKAERGHWVQIHETLTKTALFCG